MTVKATVTSTLNGQSAELVLIEEGKKRSFERKTLNGGTEEFIFTSLDGGRDKEYKVKIVPSTTDVTSTAEVNYGAEIRVDPIPHRDADVTRSIRDQATFDNGVATQQLGLGGNSLVGGLFTTALNDGEVLADDGYVYESVQAAQDAASSWIFIGPGTFNEKVIVDTSGLTIVGSGYNTLVDGGTSGNAFGTGASNITIRNLSVQTTSGGGTGADGIQTNSGSDSLTIENVTVRDSDRFGIYLSNGTDHIVNNCTVEAVENSGIVSGSSRVQIVNSTILGGVSGQGINTGGTGENIVSNNVIQNTDRGINVGSGDDGIIIGNRIISCASDGIDVGSNANDNIVAKNRISDSGGADINDNGTGTLLDSNLTGTAN